MIEAFYKQPTLIPYNGNILVDKGSMIVQIPCDSEPLASIDEPPVNVSPSQGSRDRTPPNPPVTPDPPTYDKIEPQPVEKEVKLFDVEKKDLAEGLELRINNLTFKADSSNINTGSFEELDKIYRFFA